jgi:N-acetylmuramoyl-L-alanine amidase
MLGGEPMIRNVTYAFDARLRRSAVVAAIGFFGVAGCSASPMPNRAVSGVGTSASSPTLPQPARAVSSSPAPPTSSIPAAPAPAKTTARPMKLAPAPTKVARGTTIVLNPGHNGGNAGSSRAISRQVAAGFGQSKDCDTTGTEADAGYSEHAFNWDVSLRVRTLLRSRGVTVIMTRSSDDTVGPCVDERARIGNEAGVVGVVSIHADGASSSGHGFHVSEDSRQPHGAETAAASHRLTVDVHDALLAGSGMTTSTYLGSNGYYPRSDLAGLNMARVPATFLEIGNMRNEGDSAIQMSPGGRQRIAAAVADGILRWLSR